MLFFKKKKEKDSIVSGALKEIIKLSKSNFSEKSVIRLNEILRIFLDKKYNLKQSLTIKELIPLVKAKRIAKENKQELAFILLELYDIEYLSDHPITNKTFKLLVKKIRKFVSLH